MNIMATLTVDFKELTDSIDDRDKASELIKAIDRSMSDYEFTSQMAKYFVQELINECKFSDEEFDIKELLP